MIATLPTELAAHSAAILGLVERWSDPGVTELRLVGTGNRRDDAPRIVALSGRAPGWTHSLGVSIPLPGPSWMIEIRSNSALIAEHLAFDQKVSPFARDVETSVRLSRSDFELAEMTGALIDANDQLLSLYDLARSSASSLSRTDVMQTLVEDARRLTGAHVTMIRTGDECYWSGAEPEVGELLVVAANPDNHDRVVRAAWGQHPFDVSVRQLGDGDQNIMAVGSRRNQRFTTPQLKLVEAVAAHASGMVTLASMHEQELANAVLERDVTTAAALAAQVLPSSPPSVEGLDVFGRCDPARFAAGDFYTYVETADGLVFIAGDVSGKGLPAALVMAMVSASVTAAAHREREADPTALLNALSEEVYEYLSDVGMFVTIAIGWWRKGSNRIDLANAGHSPVLLRTTKGVQAIAATAPPLGVLRDMGQEVVEFDFEPGDVLLLGTDGLAEQENATGVQLGYDDLHECFANAAAPTAKDLVDDLFELVEDHGRGVAQDDDRTALVVRRQDKSHGPERE